MGSLQFLIMDSFGTMFRRGSAFKYDTIFNNAPITDAQKSHITKVYNTLAYTGLVTFLAIAVKGPWIHLNPIIGALLLLGSVTYLIVSSYNKDSLNIMRLAAITLFSMGIGIIYRNFIITVFEVNQEIVHTALMSSVAIFATFSLAALYLSDRSQVFVTSAVVSLTLYILLATFANIFFGSSLTHSIVLALGILIFVGHIILDTQKILEDFSHGCEDYIMHAMLLYYDLFDLFLQILVTLRSKNSRNRKSKEESS